MRFSRFGHRAWIGAGVILVLAAPALRAQDVEPPRPIFRHMAGLRLGDRFKKVQQAYPALSEKSCVAARENRMDCRIGHAKAKLPSRVEALELWFQRKRLISIEQDFDAEASRKTSVEKLAGEYALDYGVPRRSGENFAWSDGKTELRVFAVEVPLGPKDSPAVGWRTAVRIADRGD